MCCYVREGRIERGECILFRSDRRVIFGDLMFNSGHKRWINTR